MLNLLADLVLAKCNRRIAKLQIECNRTLLILLFFDI